MLGGGGGMDNAALKMFEFILGFIGYIVLLGL
jgi:hypothetical protein